MIFLQKWHPDKHKGDSAVTAKFQEINEAYKGDSSAWLEPKNSHSLCHMIPTTIECNLISHPIMGVIVLLRRASSRAYGI